MMICTFGNFAETAIIAYLVGAFSAGFVFAASAAALHRRKLARSAIK